MSRHNKIGTIWFSGLWFLKCASAVFCWGYRHAILPEASPRSQLLIAYVISTLFLCAGSILQFIHPYYAIYRKLPSPAPSLPQGRNVLRIMSIIIFSLRALDTLSGVGGGHCLHAYVLKRVYSKRKEFAHKGT